MSGLFSSIEICKRDMVAALRSPSAYIFVTVFNVAAGFLYFQTFFISDLADMRPWFDTLPWLLTFLIPALSMRSIAEERRMKTLELLMSWPVSSLSIVVGKYLSILVLCFFAITMSFTIPLTLVLLGRPDLGAILGGYIGAFLLVAFFASIGIFASALAENQIAALLIASSLCFTFAICGSPFVTAFLPHKVSGVFSFLGITPHLEGLSRGVIDIRDIIYFVSAGAAFLFAAEFRLSVWGRS